MTSLSIRPFAAVAWELRSSTRAWHTLRNTVTPGSTGSRRLTTTTRSASTSVTAGGVARGSRTAGRSAELGGLPLPLGRRRRFPAPLGRDRTVGSFCRAARLLDARLERGHQVRDPAAGEHIRRR